MSTVRESLVGDHKADRKAHRGEHVPRSRSRWRRCPQCWPAPCNAPLDWLGLGLLVGAVVSAVVTLLVVL